MRIVGNLDVEVTWARMDAAARRARGDKAPSPDDPRFALPEPVMRKISAAATLLRVFATSDDDVLWTPRPVDPSRMPEVDWWMPRVRLESGLLPNSADRWWGEPTEVAARVNHRVFAYEMKVRYLMPRLPGAMLIHSIEELKQAASDLWVGDPVEWVAKAPLSAAGRLRVRGMNDEVTAAACVQAQRLLELQGVLLFEPWVNRIVDFGVAGTVFPARTDVHGVHRLQVDRAGRFVGITSPSSGLHAHHGVAIGAAAANAGEALRHAGYAGSFGIDGFLHGDPESPSLQCISEINARMTFGLVAARIIDMAGETLRAVGQDDPVTLRFGRGAPPDGTIPLLLPGADDDTSAWLEVPPRHAG